MVNSKQYVKNHGFLKSIPWVNPYEESLRRRRARWRSLFWMTSNPLSWSLAAWEVWAWWPPRHFVRLGTEGEPRHAVEGNRKKSKVVWSFVTGSNGFDLPNFDRSHFRSQICRLTSENHPKWIILMSLWIYSVLDFFHSGVHQGGVDPTKSPRIWVPAVSSSARVVGKWQLAMRWRTTCLGVINSSTLW